MKRNSILLVIALFVGALLFVSCAGQKGPAELAIKSAEEAINATKVEAEKYVPDQMAELDNALAAVKDKFAKGEYGAVIPEAQSLVTKAKGVLDAAMAKKDELMKNWTDLSQGVPGMLEAIQGKVDSLAKSFKLPAGLTAEKFEEVKTTFTSAKEDWTKALESFKAGNYADAVSVAGSVKEKAMQTMQTLGITTATAESKS